MLIVDMKDYSSVQDGGGLWEVGTQDGTDIPVKTEN